MTAAARTGADPFRMRNPSLPLAALALFLAGCHAPPSAAPAPPLQDAPRPGDVDSIDGLLRAFYEVVNIPPDAPRQWARDRSLYVPWIRFIATGTSSTTGRTEAEAWDHRKLVEETEPLIRRGFREREIHRVTRRYGPIAHVDSTYETEYGLGPAARRSRGVNSLELYFDGRRWWIASVLWMSEDADHPIPAALLPAPKP